MLKITDNAKPLDVATYVPPSHWERFVQWLHHYGIDRYLVGATLFAVTIALLIGGILNLVMLYEIDVVLTPR